jgi:hypothetical protein
MVEHLFAVRRPDRHENLSAASVLRDHPRQSYAFSSMADDTGDYFGQCGDPQIPLDRADHDSALLRAGRRLSAVSYRLSVFAF